MELSFALNVSRATNASKPVKSLIPLLDISKVFTALTFALSSKLSNTVS